VESHDAHDGHAGTLTCNPAYRAFGPGDPVADGYASEDGELAIFSTPFQIATLGRLSPVPGVQAILFN
jgi:hypothetical protein